ncbi:tRNA (N(6)-L-threonylcarbamoyladenosine(37)-C(2))-methylthiotransferase MtaB [Candidatus Levibacter sp. Uisw_134_01]|uniref:tRNA (N(6)-L-threonylcarbamoyladenosine(37)-C(2))- methylthiotransferase MtaB n=1 Tax=Candidatus Levibacter sp. Uisw_134_01 TaxID=3230999 RepID=UPI003D3AE98B
MTANIKNKNSIPEIKTFGCRLNIWESQVISDHASKYGHSDLIIFNTCAVTSEAERQARQAIRSTKKDRPDAKILVTGCAAQINPKIWNEMPEVNFVAGNREKLDEKFWENFGINNDIKSPNNIFVDDIMNVKETSEHLVDSFNNHTRGFVQVQNGCDHRCTFCIIPFGRGPSRSVSTQNIINSINSLLKNGVKEVVLTGVDLTSWGGDIFGKPSLGLLVKKILKNIPHLPRLRLSSIDPAEVDFELMDAIENEERLMPHIHLSIQHGDDLILKRMKRRHLNRDVINFVKEVKRRRSDIVFGGDFISGFPTEDNKSHQKSIDLIKAADITYVHVFPYSDREGTPASKMPKVSGAVIKKRAKDLRVLAETQRQNFFKTQVGTIQDVLIEKNSVGYAPNFSKIKVNKIVECSNIVSTKILDFNSEGLVGCVNENL